MQRMFIPDKKENVPVCVLLYSDLNIILYFIHLSDAVIRGNSVYLLKWCNYFFKKEFLKHDHDHYRTLTKGL